jgi:hypothetical protein
MKKIITYKTFNENNKCDIFIKQIKKNIEDNDYKTLYETLIKTIKNNCDLDQKYFFNNTLFYLFIKNLDIYFNENTIKDIVDLFINNGAVEIINLFDNTPMLELFNQKNYDLIEYIITKHKNYKIFSNLIFNKILTNRFNNSEKIKLLNIFRKSDFFDFYKKFIESYYFDLLPIDVQEQFPDIKINLNKLKSTNKFNI